MGAHANKNQRTHKVAPYKSPKLKAQSSKEAPSPKLQAFGTVQQFKQRGATGSIGILALGFFLSFEL